MKYFRILIFYFLFSQIIISDDSLISTFKGIGGGLKSFESTIGSTSFWKGMGRSFGASPTGYIYNYSVFNDTSQKMYVGTQQYFSLMGAYFPSHNGWSQDRLDPFDQSYVVNGKEYYFELHLDDHLHSSPGMPYSMDGALLLKDCIELPKKTGNSKMDFYRFYIGKKIEDGRIIHAPMAEYLGYTNHKNPKDKKVISFSSILTGDPALVIYNSTDSDVIVGYSSQKLNGPVKRSDCDLFLAKIEANSFITHAALKIEQMLSLYGIQSTGQASGFVAGTVAVFDNKSEKSLNSIAFPKKLVSGLTYTVEIYQDRGGAVDIGFQAITENHDNPSDRTRDITAINSVFWNQSVKQLPSKEQKGRTDLPGRVWVLSVLEDEKTITFPVATGKAVQFKFNRPRLGKERNFFFIYLDEKDLKKEEAFINNFIAGKIGTEEIDRCKKEGVAQWTRAQKALVSIRSVSASGEIQDSDIHVPVNLLVDAVRGALNVKNGKIVDPSSGVTGYLVGTDIFLSSGMPISDTVYYQLPPVQKEKKIIIRTAVSNFATFGQTKRPDKMPNPIIYPAKNKSKIRS